MPNRVKELRIKKSLSQNSLAVKVGVTPKYISFIENGQRTPSLAVAEKLSFELGASIEDIFLRNKCTERT